MTSATLYNIEQLEVQKKKVEGLAALGSPPQIHCTGLLIHHGNGVIETLGVWDGSREMESLVIYNAKTDGPLAGLVFLLSHGGRLDDRPSIAYHVIDIIAKLVQKEGVVNPDETDHTDLILRGGKVVEFEISHDQPPIIWCFTEWIDHIGTSTNEMKSVNMKRNQTCRLKQIR
ncbi:hypothetical protein Trco_003764 [Trichoderma cornu-damae]|uniref:Uncharacterized protein n=1 Tax=Trichoderma cornu-damae TaxID=654480 RepID=A0A9P8QJC7_9HYPO|nr:hypothetical protein Trco_003764 [Trichoderma cornu-damae]